MPESRNNYKKTDILLSLINELRSRWMSREQIQDFLSEAVKMAGAVPMNCDAPDKYKVHPKTVTRKLDAIRARYGDQLEEDLSYHTYKLDLHDFPDTIEDDEIQALDVAMKQVRNNRNTYRKLETLKAKLATRLFRKLEHTEPKRAARRINEIDQKINSDQAVMGPRLIVDFDEKIKPALESAITSQHEIQFTYYKRNKHTVCPLGILYGTNNVYLICYECKDGKVCSNPRHYILSEISDLVETNNSFDRGDFSIEEFANSMFGVYNDGVEYDVEWLIKDYRTIKIAKKYKFHKTQEFFRNDDGSLKITMHTGGLHEMSMFLATWGGKIIPVKPKELVDEYETLLRNCLDSIKK